MLFDMDRFFLSCRIGIIKDEDESMYYIYKIRTVRENNNKIFLRNRNISLSKRCLYFHFNFLMDSKKIYSENYWTQLYKHDGR